MIYECKHFLDTNIYRSFNILQSLYATFFRNFDKGIKYSKGIYVDNLISDCITQMALSYNHKNIKDKLQYAYKCKEDLFILEIHLKSLFESYRCLAEHQYNSLCKECGKIEEQLELWIKSKENL